MPPGTGASLARSRIPKVRPRRLSHVLLFSPNVADAIAFYQGALGLRPGQSAGRMGTKWDPWFVQPCTSVTYGCLPGGFTWQSSPEKGEIVVPYRHTDPDFCRAPSLTLPEGVGPDRLDARRKLLAAVERQRRDLDRLAGTGKFARYRE